jgi:hypothetical protein
MDELEIRKHICSIKATCPSELNDTIEELIVILEQQIPKPAIKIHRVPSQSCPVCKANVNFSYCPRCGQRIEYGGW